MFKKRTKPEQPKQNQQDQKISDSLINKETFKIGDVISNKYEVYGVLGKGGCGVVYHVYSKETNHVFALKTFLDKYLSDVLIRERFKKEASIWVGLDKNPYIVKAHFIEQISGRLFIGMEYITPNERRWNTLEDHIRYSKFNYIQSLRWAIQFCYGMEYAYSKGIKAHRDIKPANIMITSDRTIKISDFGLAGFIDARNDYTVFVEDTLKKQNDFQTMLNVGMGTPTHMSPEQFDNAAECNEQSDIYSFGIVLYQMVSGGELPFITDNPTQFWNIMKYKHKEEKVPHLNSIFDPIIQRCLEKEPNKRFSDFKEIRDAIEKMFERETGEKFKYPTEEECTASDLCNKGLSLDNLGRHNEAINCYKKAINISPNIYQIWNNLGLALNNAGKYEEAINVLNKAISINPNYESSWLNRGVSYERLGRFDEAYNDFIKTLEIDSDMYLAYYNIGNYFLQINKFDDAYQSYIKSLNIYPFYSPALGNAGKALIGKGEYSQALHYIEMSLAINPLNWYALYNKSLCYIELGKITDAIAILKYTLSIENNNIILKSLANCYIRTKEYDWALSTIESNPESNSSIDIEIIRIKTQCYLGKGELAEALKYITIAHWIAPSDASIIFEKAIIEDNLFLRDKALKSYSSFVDLSPDKTKEEVVMAMGRVASLKAELTD